MFDNPDSSLGAVHFELNGTDLQGFVLQTNTTVRACVRACWHVGGRVRKGAYAMAGGRLGRAAMREGQCCVSSCHVMVGVACARRP